MMRRAAISDAGFSILELVVALAIASLVTMATSGLFLLSFGAHERIQESQKLQTVLLDLQSIFRLGANGPARRIAEPKSDGFALVTIDDATDRLSVQLGQSSLAVMVDDQSVAQADLAIFDATSLQYLIATPETVRWREATDLVGAQPIAARLRLVLNHRTWRPLIWLSVPNTL